MKWFTTFNAFLNNPTRGPGHGHGNALFYGVILLALAPLPLWCLITAMCLNHGRVLYQELIIEGWAKKPKSGDYFYDAFFRPATSHLVAILPHVPIKFWPLLSLAILLMGYQSPNEWPWVLHWRKK